MQINEEPLSKYIIEELILESNVRLFMLQSRNPELYIGNLINFSLVLIAWK